MPVDRDALAALHQRLTEQLAALTTGDEWLAFLKASRQFHRYSPHNQMLLLMQGAHGHVASYSTWQRIPAEGGGTCQVRKGERGLVVLAPMTLVRARTDPLTGDETNERALKGFKPVKVFHQGQLVDPPDLATPPLPRLLRGENRHHHVWAAVESRLEERGFSVDKVSRSPVETWNGRTDFSDRSVVVSDHLEPPAALKTLLHEWAHVVLSHDVRQAGRPALREVEAESAAYLVCATIGVDSAEYSVPYLASWAGGDGQLLQDTAQMALAAAATMVSELEQELSVDLTPEMTPDGRRSGRSSQRQASAQPTPLRDTTSTRLEPLPGLGDAPSDEIVTALAALMTEAERTELLDALADIDRRLDVAIERLADAGLDTDRITRLLVDRGVSIEQLGPALIRDSVEHHPDRPGLRPDVIGLATTAAQHSAQPANVGRPASRPAAGVPDHHELLGPDDRVVVDRLIASGSLVEAGRALAGAGLDVDQVRTVLNTFDLEPEHVSATLQATTYNPATGRHEPLWPATSAPDAPSEPSPRASDVGLPHHVIQRVGATGDSIRMAHLAEAYGLSPAESVGVWAEAGLAPNLIAKATTVLCGGNVQAAVQALESEWSGEHVDWTSLTTADTTDQTQVGASTADAILREWEHTSRTIGAASAEMA